VSFFEGKEPSQGSGAGLWEAPRGAVGHWMSVEGGRISNYQICTPSTWNIGGRDDDGVTGVMEQALIGTPVLDPTKPLEAARIARSFDP
jgi:Ni,Fe-hydrogenase I large subunit